MTNDERQRIREAARRVAATAPPIPDDAARIIREAFRIRPTKVTR